jgi:hypothetical protein
MSSSWRAFFLFWHKSMWICIRNTKFFVVNYCTFLAAPSLVPTFPPISFFDCLMGESNVLYNVSFYFFLHRYLLLYGYTKYTVCISINTLPYALVQGFGSGSALIWVAGSESGSRCINCTKFWRFFIFVEMSFLSLFLVPRYQYKGQRKIKVP